MSIRLLVVDEDDQTAVALRGALECDGARVIHAVSGTQGLRLLYSERPHLVLLDIAVSEPSGWQTLERMRQVADTPVLIVSERSGELEKVRALRGGADDYVTKPFRTGELLARAEAVLRRAAKSDPAPSGYDDGTLMMDFVHAEARVRGEPLEVTPLEFRMLTMLVRNRNRILSRDQLLVAGWGDNGYAPERVKVVIGTLRAKLRARDIDPIETVRGFGYRYRPPR